jgi:hypothetical protein
MIQKALHNKAVLFSYASASGILNLLNDTTYLKMMYKVNMGKSLNLDCPKTFNEKLQWLKIHDRNPLYTSLVDKYDVKKYVATSVGEKYIIPTLGVWNHFDEIDFDTLPNRFVLKCTHDSGGIVICKNKRELDKDAAKKLLEKCLKRNYYWYGREWPYKNVKPRIIAEKYISDGGNLDSELTDYKFFCFNGRVDNVMVCLDRDSGSTKFYFFTPDWKLLRINKRGKAAPANFTLPRPDCLDEMVKVAKTLSEGMPFVRIDLYQSNKKVYFGEITFFPDSGIDSNILPETDLEWGHLLKLDNL